jgi:membrane protease YdiL (CAAX protease family)
MALKAWLLSGRGCVAVSIALTLIVLAESMFPPWAPYFVVYAVLAIAIPLSLRSYRFGPFWTVLKSHRWLILAMLAVVILFDQGVATWLYERFLTARGLGGNPHYSLDAAMVNLADVAARKFSVTRDTALMLYALFVVVWAPVGEELFYRGYVQERLRQTLGFGISASVSAFFFGIRHATHFFFLWPDIPWGAMANWVVGTFVFGLFMSYLYEKTRSLTPPMLIHAAMNVVGIALTL